MLKKFVPLTANESPSRNPYEVRTFLGEHCKRRPEWKVELCRNDLRNCPPNNTIAKILTIEDEIRRIHEKSTQSRFQGPFKPFCAFDDEYLTCIVPQRTPKDLKTHAIMRERYLLTKRELASRVHSAAYHRKTGNLIELESPVGATEEEEAEYEDNEEGAEEEDAKQAVRPELATPSCSLDAIYLPPERVLELTRPSSGWFHNETEPPQLEEDGINYSVYNPRLLQEQLDAQDLGHFDVIEGKTPLDLWTWNIGKQEHASDLDRDIKEARVFKFDCDNLELKLFKIPNDLDKTFRVEIVFGNDAIRLDPPRLRPLYVCRPAEIASIYVAYVDSFRLNPDFWTAETMDSILKTGDKLLKRSAALNFLSDENDYDIITQITERNAVVGLKVHFSGPIRSEPNIYKALSLYFSKYNSAVLSSDKLFLLIWKRCSKSFYIFDPNGRNENCERDFEDGKCSLISIHYIEHLVHLIMNYSAANLNKNFNLFEIFLINYGKITNPMQTKPFPKSVKRMWNVVNSFYAVIPAATTGLSQPITGKEQNASMMISLLALLYSGIERAKNWQPETLDDLNKFGTTYFKYLVRRLKLKKNQQLDILDLPEYIMMGSHKAAYKTRPFLYTGHVADCKDFRDSQLTLAIKDLYSSQWEAGLLQIDNSVLAIWRDKEIYYVFDPFRRSRVGQVLDPDDYRSRGIAILQMHTTFDSFCRILYENALQMRRGGKFFLHGVKIGCIKPLVGAAHLKNRYPHLKLEYPKFEEIKPQSEDEESKVIKTIKKGKLERTVSIKSLPDEQRLPEFTTQDIVHGVVEEFLCDLISTLPEPQPPRSRLYKQAEQVLLRTDKPYLKMLKYQMKHKLDEDNLNVSRQLHPDQPERAMTLEEELRMPSNYELLPDGTWVIFGTSDLPLLEEDTTKLGGLLAAIVSTALSAKYRISTWNADLIEYALEAVNAFGEDFDNYEQTLSAFLNQKMPRITIGSNVYELEIKKITHASQANSLRQQLLQSLICFNRLMVVCQRFSCVILKRYNFLYMFIGFACNPVGYRKFGPGPACMLRFIELDALIRRIEFGCDPHGCEITNYVVVALKVTDVTYEPPHKYLPMLPKDDRVLYGAERERLKSQHRTRLEKAQFLEDEIRKENERIEKFLSQKKKRAEERKKKREARRRRRGKKDKKSEEYSLRTEDEMEGDEEGIEETEEEVEEEVELKHQRGKHLKREIMAEFLPRPVLYGYQLRAKDHLYKIQGTVALPNRADASVEEIKPCFFASSVAIIYAVLRPLNQWPASRIDRVVNTGVTIASQVTNMTTAYDRMINKITADEYTFDIYVKTYEPAGVEGMSVSRKLEHATNSRRYMLLQTSNCTYAIYHDEYFHLFDPYGSMDTINEGEEGDEDANAEEEAKKKSRKYRGIQKYCERNTASWVLFAEIEQMLKYIDARAANPDWRTGEEYKFHVVDIISYRKAQPKERIIQLLTDMEVSPYCGRHQDEAHICARPETQAWLDMDSCLPIWSRLNRHNTAGRVRGIGLTRAKKFDIEIDKRLWSVWGCLSPYAPCFSPQTRGKQFLACNIVACLAGSLYRLANWSPQLLDNIIISGDRYQRESLANITLKDYEFSLEDLGTDCFLGDIRFAVHLEYVAFGKLYAHGTRTRMNLADALMYFFTHFQFGVLQCQKRSLAIGRTLGHDGGYFMFDCQSRDHPIFPRGQGAAYLLRTSHLQVLLYCIVVTLSVPYYNVPFTLHKVDMLREGALVEESGEGG